MSEYYRFKRLIRSMMPDFSRRKASNWYSSADVRMVINDLAFDIPPKVLKAMTTNDRLLDDFTNKLYLLEEELERKVVTDFAVLDPNLEPKVFVEGNRLGFTVMYRGKRLMFAEYTINAKDLQQSPPQKAREIPIETEEDVPGDDELMNLGL
ncbi:MAG: hypothetical protein AAGI38_02180 [Bacteroidota bacterium]